MTEMNRRKFLQRAGTATAGVACVACLGSCVAGANSVTGPAASVDFTLDLAATTNAALLTTGGSLLTQGVLVIKSASGYVAVSSTCTHDGVRLQYRSSGDIYCSAHGSVFSLDGAVVQGPARSALAKYQTSLSGQSLRVFT